MAEAEYKLHAVPTGQAWDPASISSRPEWLDPKRGSIRMLTDLVIPRTAELVKTARKVAVDLGPHAVIGHHISFGLPWIAGERDIPWIMCAVAPSSWPSVLDPNLYPGMPDRERYPRWTIRLGTVIAGRMIGRAVDPAINAVRRDLGLAPQRNAMLEGQFSRSRNLGLWSEHFRGLSADDPPGACVVGFPPLASAVQLNSYLANEIQHARSVGEPLAVWSLGTTAVHAGRQWHNQFVTAAQATGYRPIVLTGCQATADQLHHRGIAAAAYAPHGALFQFVDVVVHHAGIGTTAAALLAGVPSVAVPFTHDQPDNARRLRRMNLAHTITAKDRTAPQRFQNAMKAALAAVNSPGIRESCRTFSARLKGDTFDANVVRAIESVV